MKKIYTIVLVLALFSSCNYLDVTPTGKVIPETVTDFRAMMTSAYSKVPSYKRMLTVRSDEVVPFMYGYFFNNYVDLALWEDVNPDPMTASYHWTEIYNVIFYANSVIEEVMGAEIDTHTDSREQLKGEALLLRALMHFDLLNLYAKYYDPATAMTDRGIPLSLKVDIDQEYKPATVEQVYTQVLADIEEGMGLMEVEEQPATTCYRFSLKAAKAFKAKVLLYKRQWAESLAIAEDLLASCPLTDMNRDTGVPPYENTSVEAILFLDGVGTIDIASDMVMNGNFMALYNTGKAADDSYLDRRVGMYFEESWTGETVPRKYGNSKAERATLRSADVWLMAAEAAAHDAGKLGTAKGYLKQLLEKRLEPDYYNERALAIDGMNQEQLLTEIQDERGRELALEGQRWFDLRRTTRPRIEKSFLDMNYEEHSAVLEKDDSRYVIRFPKEAIANNPNLAN